MKKLVYFLFLSYLFLSQNSQAVTCHVVAKNGSGEGSLPWQVQRINEGKCNEVLFTTMPAPLKVTLTEPLIIPAGNPAMISGANYGSGDPLAPLGVVIDARNLESCAIKIENPDQFSIRYLSLWVKNWNHAICDFQGNPVLRQKNSAYLGDEIIHELYPALQVCIGSNQSQTCTEAPLPPSAPIPYDPKDIDLGPQTPEPDPIPPGPGDFFDCADSDSDQVCDDVDLCNLSNSNPQAIILAATLAEQCPDLLIGKTDPSPLCSQVTDLDGDQIGNACDSDADGDGFPNSIEKAWGTNPLDSNDFPKPPSEEPQDNIPQNPVPNPNDSPPENYPDNLSGASCQIQTQNEPNAISWVIFGTFLALGYFYRTRHLPSR